MVERYRLFFIIALGESVLVTGREFSDPPFETQRLAALVISFVGTVALWWCYFQGVEAIGIDAAESADDGGAVGWEGTWTLTVVLLALIAIAVSAELAIAHPSYEAYPGFTILTFRGPAGFLLAQTVFLRNIVGYVAVSRLLAIAALGVLALVTSPFNLLVGVSAAACVLIAIAAADTIRPPTRPAVQAHGQ